MSSRRVMLVVWLLSALSARMGQTQTSQLVYEERFTANAFEQGWDNWSWSLNLNSTSAAAFQGSRSLQVDYNSQWSGLYFHAGNSFFTGGYDALTLAVNGGTTGGQNLVVGLKDVSGNDIGSANITDYIDSNGIPANGWVNVIIPLGKLNGINTFISGIIVMNSSSGGATTIYLDSVKFDKVGLSFGGNIYSEGPEPGWQNWSWAQTTFFGNGGARHGYKEIQAHFWNIWDGVYLHNVQGGTPVAGYNYLEFSLNGKAQGYNDLVALQIQLTRPDQTAIGTLFLANYISGTIIQNQWYDFAIPLSDFGVQATDILGGVTFMQASSYPLYVWLDDINIAGQRRHSASGNLRRNVVLEAFYALRVTHDGGCDNLISGNCVSSWNYLNDDATFHSSDSGQPDTSSYGVVKGWYGCDSSVWVTNPLDPCYYNGTTPVDFYRFAANYGFGPWSGQYGAIGRGGECKYFANLILFRSGSYKGRLPSYAEIMANSTSNFQAAREGDILVSSLLPHVAIVVEIKRDTNGNVSHLDVIDANWLRDTPGGWREVIGRHSLSIASLQANSFVIWTGGGLESPSYVSYYNSTYIPN